jgi:hypothetical protein
MSEDRQVVEEWDSTMKTETAFVTETCAPFQDATSSPHLMVVEDIPHRLPYRTLVKEICRLQGRIIDRMAQYGLPRAVYFVPPSEWRKYYPPLRKRGSGPVAVVQVAAELGYFPPDLTRLHGARGGRALANKVATDYCAAFLIGYWALECIDELAHERVEVGS